jgi:hypothetical protein
MGVTKIRSRWDKSGYEGMLDFYREDTGVSVLTIAESGLVGAPNPSGGMDYYVENNYGLDTNDGLSWGAPYKTLAKAIAVSNVYIALDHHGWAARNRIFYRADEETADLAAFPNKCDVIGVGSDGQHPMAGILGNHVPVNAYTACRFFNIRFVTVTTHEIVTHDSASSATEYIGCKFDADGAAHSTIGILAVAHTYLKVVGCRFQGPFSTAYISIGAGNASGLEIKGNEMFDSAAEGIAIASTTTSTPGGIIKGNFISATTITIHDESDLFFVIDNRLVTAAAHAYATSVVVNLAKSAGNIVTGNDESSGHPVNANSAT